MGKAVFGAPEFKARSGRMVKVGEDGSLSIDHMRGYLSPEVVMDVEEWAQAKRDFELGRWRWPANPQWIVYPRRPGFVPYGDADLLVINEVDGSAMEYVATDDDGTCYTGREEPAAEAARAYFEAHPERKPWEDAKPGEVWVLTFDGADDAFKAYESRYGKTYFTRSRESSTGLVDERITAGRRIWPEDAS